MRSIESAIDEYRKQPREHQKQSDVSRAEWIVESRKISVDLAEKSAQLETLRKKRDAEEDKFRSTMEILQEIGDHQMKLIAQKNQWTSIGEEIVREKTHLRHVQLIGKTITNQWYLSAARTVLEIIAPIILALFAITLALNPSSFPKN